MAIKAGDQITIVDVTDAYSVILTSESYTFVGGTSGATSGRCTTEVVAFCGANQCPIVNVTASDIKCPTGISASVSGSGTSKVIITFDLTATLSTDCEATIPVLVDGIEINKKFSFAVAKTGAPGATGATGKGISKVETFYLTTASSSGVTTSTSGWSTTPEPTTTDNKYIWSYQKTTYTSGNPTNSTPAIIGTHGATGATGNTGATGKGISKVETFYLTTSASSGVTTNTSGWSTTPEPTTTDKKYIWSYQKTTYTSGNPTNSTPAIIGTHGTTGATGAAGADAITVTITASNGTVFKNNTGSTVLTAHVYKGGVEQSITDAGVCGSLGSIKWYIGSGTQPTGWPKTSKTITAGASSGSGIDVVVANITAITCQLEK